MPRNASAIALKFYLMAALLFYFVGAVPIPQPLVDIHIAYGYVAFGLAWLGCFISLVGIFWPRTRKGTKRQIAVLDGSVIEQAGLITATVGLLMVAIGYATAFPMLWFPTIACGGFAITFLVQWYLIRMWRKNLRRLAQGDGQPTAD